ncbi:MAG: PAP/fibrillin family protein [Gammaproteobacteria bacterium]
MSKREQIKQQVLDLVNSLDETVLCSEAEKDQLKELCDALCPYTPEPRPIDNQQAAQGVWLTRFASFGVKHSDNQPMQHASNLRRQSFGNLSGGDVYVTRLLQEIERSTQAYNNVVHVRNPDGDATAVILMEGTYARDDEDPRRYGVDFKRVSFAASDGKDEAQLRKSFAIADDAPLAVEFRPPKLHSDIVYVDDDLRINYGKLGGFYVLTRTQDKGYSVALNQG